MRLVIYHTCDVHGRLTLGGARRLARMKEADGALLFDSGDMATAPNILPAVPPLFPARACEIAGYDAVLVGNREFFFRRWGLGAMARRAGVPMIATNIEGAGALGIRRFLALEVGGAKVGVFGIVRRMVPEGGLAAAASDVRWIEPAEAIGQMLRHVAGADLIVVLSHLGLEGDVELAEQVPEVGLVLGGHDHLLTAAPLQAGRAAIVHSGWGGRFVARVEVELRPGARPEVAVSWREIGAGQVAG